MGRNGGKLFLPLEIDEKPKVSRLGMGVLSEPGEVRPSAGRIYKHLERRVENEARPERQDGVVLSRGNPQVSISSIFRRRYASAVRMGVQHRGPPLPSRNKANHDCMCK